MSKKVKHESLMDVFVPKAKKSKENPFEVLNEDIDVHAETCISQKHNSSNKHNEINYDVFHASKAGAGIRGKHMAMAEINNSNSSEKETELRKFDENTHTNLW